MCYFNGSKWREQTAKSSVNYSSHYLDIAKVVDGAYEIWGCELEWLEEEIFVFLYDVGFMIEMVAVRVSAFGEDMITEAT